MGAVFLIVFRESLEAAIVLGILLAFLKRAGLGRLVWAVWAGGGAGAVASFGIGAVSLMVLVEFEGRAEQIFEGSFMFFGAALLTALILWIDRGNMRASLEKLGAAAGSGGRAWMAIALLVFASVLREGVETVVFLNSSLRDAGFAGVASGLAGLAAATLVALLVFGRARSCNLRRFFAVTNVLLLAVRRRPGRQGSGESGGGARAAIDLAAVDSLPPRPRAPPIRLSTRTAR